MKKKLFVYYGWNKVTPIRKRECLSVIFVNSETGPRVGKDGFDGVTRFIDVCYRRQQTEAEMQCCLPENNKESLLNYCGPIRIYSEYRIFMDDPKINNSLDVALFLNSESDKYNVSLPERKKIAELLRAKYLELHKDYKEPTRQLTLNF